MFKRSRLTVLLGVSFAVTALVSLTGPAMAETVEKSCKSSRTSNAAGLCGSYQVKDTDGGKQDAGCTYGTASHLLTKLTIVPPKMYGKYATKTKVGWRFNVRRSSASHADSPHTVYTSSYQTANASTTSPVSAANGFSKRTYTLSGAPGDNDYWITVDFQWWRNGSVEGYMNISYDFYKATRGNMSHVFPSHCGPAV